MTTKTIKMPRVISRKQDLEGVAIGEFIRVNGFQGRLLKIDDYGVEVVSGKVDKKNSEKPSIQSRIYYFDRGEKIRTDCFGKNNIQSTDTRYDKYCKFLLK